ncbi:MAG: ATP-binding protein [Pseudothermotoga sp.]
MTRDEIFAVLLRWNLWGRERKIAAVPRECLEKMKHLRNYHGVVVVKGPRRSGKSTLLYQLMQEFSRETDPKSILYVNFEDYAFSSEKLTAKTLEDIFEVYRQEVYRDGDFLLFLDEIQNVEDWHRWVRTATDSGLIKTIFVTGSSSKLLSGELATLLAGRHIDFELLPFSFKEYVNAMGHSPSNKIELMAKKEVYLSLLKDYLEQGGFPEVAAGVKGAEIMNRILSQYAEDIIIKDVAMRYNVQNVKLLKALSKFLAQNTGNKVSIRKIQKYFENVFEEKSSTSTFSNYISHLESVYFCFEVQRFEYSVKEAIKSLSKYYLIDAGLRNAIYPSFSLDRGRLLENAVYLKLRNMYEEVYYWEAQNEIDFVCRNDNRLDLYNVSYVSDESEIRERKLKGFAEFPYAVRARYLITWDLYKELSWNGLKILALPAYVFLYGLPEE